MTMKKAVSLLSLFLVFTLSTKAFAQDNSLTTGLTQEKREWKLSFDMAYLFLKGFGIGFGKAVTPQLSLEGTYAHYEMKTIEDSISSIFFDYDAYHKINTAGLRATYHPFSATNKDGIYISGSLVHAELETTVDPINSDETRTLHNSKNGGQGIIGYQFISGILGQTVGGRIGLGYGMGAAVQNNLGGTYTEIRDGALFDAAVAVLF
jgi:hypothetical protein